MMPNPPGGQGPIDPRSAFAPPPPPTSGAGAPPPPPPGWMPPPQMHPQMMMPPPPVFYPAPPVQRGGGFAKAIFVTLATTIFGLSIAANIYLLLLTGLAGSGESSARSDVLAAGDPAQKIAVIPIDTIIDGEAYARFEKLIKQIENDKSVKAVVIEVDTPGGTVTASDEIYNRILKFKAKRSVPVITAMGGMATSGGYYVACATDEIFVQPTTLTGNIGVVVQRFNYSGAMEKLGVKDTSVSPEGADFKNIESPFRPETPEAAAYMRGFAEDFYGRFKTIVSTGRQGKLKDSIHKIADGRVFTAADALKLGLADHGGYPTDAYAHAAKLAGISNPTVVRYKHQPSLFEAFGATSKLSESLRGGGGVNVNIDPSLLDELQSPRAMYLWRGE